MGLAQEDTVGEISPVPANAGVVWLFPIGYI